MGRFLRYTVFGCAILLIIFGVLFYDRTNSLEKTYIIHKVLKNENFKYWTRLDGTIYCQDETQELRDKKLSILSKLIDAKISIVYFSGIDLSGCNKYLESIAQSFADNNILIAIDLEKDLKIKKLFDANLNNLSLNDFLKNLQSYSNTTQWVSYIVIDNVMQGMTFAERRQLQSALRDIFTKSFIGFRFTNDVKPTPDMKHPSRPNMPWNEFLPRDDDGDFIISTFPVGSFMRTSVYTENLNLVPSDVDGQFLTIGSL